MYPPTITYYVTSVLRKSNNFVWYYFQKFGTFCIISFNQQIFMLFLPIQDGEAGPGIQDRLVCYIHSFLSVYLVLEWPEIS